ncbi:MAG: hypothetical protein WCY60_04470 [Trueperaceae bacterium]
MTTVRVVLTLTLAAALALMAPAPAAAQGAPGQAGSTVQLPVDQLSVGDRGYGVTATAGNAMGRFGVEVLGVQHGAGNGFPLVLVRTSGALIEAAGGVAAGMSGSPVYISTEHGDALIGAIGYVFPNSDHTVALVTPIDAMRSADGAATFALHVPGYGEAVPVATPVLLTGTTRRAAELLAPLFLDPRVTPLPLQAGASAAPIDDELFELHPGSPIAVALVTGDVQLSAVGTVTTVEDGRVLAFGHPLLGLGEADLPFVPAYVTSIVASQQVPFKLANVGTRVLGVIDQDRPAAVAGGVGAQPSTVAVSLSIIGAAGDPVHEFEVAADERLYPVLVATATLQLLDRALGATTPGFADLAWEITLESGERVNVIEQVNDAADIAFGAALMSGGPLALLATNEFRAAAVQRVSISVRLRADQQAATLAEAILEAEEVAPGDAAHVHLRLQPFRQQAEVRTLTVPIPEHLSGSVTLLVRGGSVPRDTGDAVLDEEVIDPPRTFGELLDALRQRVQSSEIVVEALTEDGELLQLLRAPTPFVVLGHESVTLQLTAPATPEGDAEGAQP